MVGLSLDSGLFEQLLISTPEGGRDNDAEFSKMNSKEKASELYEVHTSIHQAMTRKQPGIMHRLQWKSLNHLKMTCMFDTVLSCCKIGSVACWSSMTVINTQTLTCRK